MQDWFLLIVTIMRVSSVSVRVSSFYSNVIIIQGDNTYYLFVY